LVENLIEPVRTVLKLGQWDILGYVIHDTFKQYE